MKKITLIVPSFNEEKNISMFYEEVQKYIHLNQYVFEILFVDDGSHDQTLLEIKKLVQKDQNVKYISLSRNFGKESAMHAGLVYAKNSDAVIIIDCDLQQPPSLIPEMIQYYEEGFKIVYTKGRTRKGEPKLRSFFANWFYRIYNAHSDMPLDNGAKDYQLLDKKVVDAFLKLEDNYRFVKGIFSWVGYERKCIEYDFIPRMNGKSSWSFKSLMKYAFNGMNQFSTILMVIPLLTVFAGFILLLVSVILLMTNVLNISAFIITLFISIFVLIFGFLNYGLFYLLYQLRRQTLNRPIYLVAETSEDDNFEKDMAIH